MKFVCQVCGYVHEGDAAPEKCPVCGVPYTGCRNLDVVERCYLTDRIKPLLFTLF